MVLSDLAIKEAIIDGDLSIEPFEESCLRGASYDLRIGAEALMSGDEKVLDLSKEKAFVVKPGEFAIINTLEQVKTSQVIIGRIGVRSYYTRKGLVFLSGLQIDPGFEGTLVLGMYNAAPRKIYLEYGEPFCSVEFHRLHVKAERVYPSDSYQKAGHLPRVDKEYLRALETESLTDMSEALRELTRSVGAMSRLSYYVVIPLIIGLYITLFTLFLVGPGLG